MAERDPIDLINEQLNRLETMTGLHDEHDVFKNWHAETKQILEKAFGSKSIHYQSFAALRFREVATKAFASPEIDRINAARYKKDMENVKTVLNGAIKELTIDRTLFKKIPSTPKTVDVSLAGELFVSSAVSEPEMHEAIFSALKESGLHPILGSEALRRGDPLSSRIDQIRRARVGLYDLSSPEKGDGLLEIGIALGMGKDIILLHKKGACLSETAKQLNRIEYETVRDLTEALKARIG